MRVDVFYLECVRRAFTGKFWLVEKWAGGLAVLTSLFAAVVPAKLLHVTDVEMVNWATFFPGYFFAFVFAVAVISGFVLAPAKMYQEQVELRVLAELKRKAKIDFFIHTSSLEVIAKGNTSESIGGYRQTVESMGADGIATVYCRNTGEETAKNCAIHLLSFSKNGKEVPLLLPVQLAWGTDLKTQTTKEDIAPNETKRMAIARIAQGGQLWLFRPIGLLPTEHQRLLGDAGTYRVTIQVSSDTTATVQADLEIIALPADPVKVGITRPKGSISLLKTKS